MTAISIKKNRKNRIRGSVGSQAFDVVNVAFIFLFLQITLFPSGTW